MTGRTERDAEVARQFFEAAMAHAAAGRHHEAIDAYSRVIELMPEVEAAHFNLGNAWFALNEFQQAADAYRRAVALNAEPSSLNNLGNALGAAGQLEAAVQAFQDALALDQHFLPARSNLGKAFLRLGQASDAMVNFEAVLRHQPDNVTARRLVGDCLVSMNRLQEAVKQYEGLLESDGQRTDILVQLGKVHAKAGKFRLAMDYLVQAQQQEPNNPLIYGELGEVNRSRGQIAEALLCFARAIQGDPDLSSVHGEMIATFAYDPSMTAERLLIESQGWSQRFGAEAARRTPLEIRPARDRRLRIGYISAGFPSETVGCLLQPLLHCHDSATVEIFCYDTSVDQREAVQELRAACANWCNLSFLSNDGAADRIRQDNIDVLVDLAGHSCSRTLLVMARRPASVQVTWFGHPATTGLPQIDFILADRVVISSAHESNYSECAERLPDCYLCYAPPKHAADIVARSMQKSPSGVFTLGCFDEMAKLSPEAIACWAQVIHAIPNSRLVLKNFALQDEGVRQRVQSMFAAHEVDAAKLTLMGHRGDGVPIEDYHELDIYLSPFPFAGEITTLRALWMGVPVVARTGQRYSERVSESFLRLIGQHDWVCQTDQDYVEKVVELASDESQRATLRQTIHQCMNRSPLCKPTQFTRQLEIAYRRMWEQAMNERL